ncbi:MAG: DUF2239 family protein [Proteobacteria bacterium]|nr:DUF2239 family protein [Pseudomonadota bacterium]
MTNIPAQPTSALRCTAFDGTRRLASGPYAEVAVAVKQRVRDEPDAAILIFDDRSGREIDFDLRGSDRDIAERVARQFAAASEPARSAGRPKLGVVAREVTLLPRHWEWLAAQPGGASAALRRLVETASRAGGDDRAVLRDLQERTYRFMAAMAGNLPGFEEASRALFAGKIAEMETHIATWPADVRAHVLRLFEGDAAPPV